MQYDIERAVVCVVGLGYVGLPLALAFARSLKVIGFDIDSNKIKELDRNNQSQNVHFTGDPRYIKQADFVIIAVPTPLTKSKTPDLSHVMHSSTLVAENLRKGAVVVLESTVYPGVTEEVVKPILEGSGLECGCDFKIAYSPERINPGDEEHTLDRVTKVVSGIDGETTEIVAQLYSKVTSTVFKAKDIKTAEAAKVIENIQRDLNIALMNELAIIFGKMGLSTKEVLEAAATKWNFHGYSPGLVGGHCIPVDPHYLVYKAEELGYHPQVILAGRAINDYMPKHIAQMTIKALNQAGKVIKGSRVLIMGLTYKENVADTRETPVREIIRELREYGVEMLGHDPFVEDIEAEFGIVAVGNVEDLLRVDAIVLAVAHSAFEEIGLDKLKGIMSENPTLVDVRAFYNRQEAERRGFYYRSL